MKKEMLVEYFEEVETVQEYNGYFCSISEAISIVVLGSICGLRNVSQIHLFLKLCLTACLTHLQFVPFLKIDSRVAKGL